MSTEVIQDSNTTNFTWLDLIKTIWYFMDGQKAKYLFWIIVLFTVLIYQLVPPIFLGLFVDFFSNYQIGDSLNYFYALVFLFGFLNVAVAIVRLAAKKKVGDIQIAQMTKAKVKGFENLLNLSLKQHGEENTGVKVQRVEKGVSSVLSILRRTSDIFTLITGIGGVIGFFIVQDVKYAFLLIIYVLVFSIIQRAFNSKIKSLQEEYNIASEKASGNYIEGLSNILTIKTLGVKSNFTEKIGITEEKKRELSEKTRTVGNMKWRFFNTLNAIFIIVYLLLVGNDIATSLIGVGAIIVYYNYLTNVMRQAGDSTDLIDELIENKLGIGRMMPIFWDAEKVSNGKIRLKKWSKIFIKNGEFTYKSDEDNFHVSDLNFEINKGDKIGIAGRSGSGKSTLVKLLLGLYKLQKGDFKVDKTDYYKLDEEDITNRISVVLQESELFNMSLKDNITVMKELDLDRLALALKVSQLEELISKLPDGVESIIGEKGYRVSGGERQRIGIARAIYKNSDIIIFDEATSNLDSKTEEAIQNAIEENLSDKTLIFIAHRLSTLRNVNKVYVFDKGEIIENGGFDELINKEGSKFAELYRIQKIESSN